MESYLLSKRKLVLSYWKEYNCQQKNYLLQLKLILHLKTIKIIITFNDNF